MEGLCEPCSEHYIDSGINVDGTLIIAAWRGHVNCVRALIDEGADVNNTSLTSAVIKGRDECVNILLEAGADVDEQSNILEKSAAFGQEKWLKFLIQNHADICRKSGSIALIKAVEANQFKCVNVLLNAGVDVNTTTVSGHTVLMKAAKYECIECVEALLHAGALVNVYNDYGNIALAQYLFWSEHRTPNRELCMLLFAAGETVEVTSYGYLKRDIPPGRYVVLRRYFLLANAEVPEYLINTRAGLCLKAKCREVIRNHLLELNRIENLFIRVPKLGLPIPLTKYLLYGY